MRITSRRGTIVFFLCLGVGLVALAVALNVGWIILNWREGVLLFFGLIFFALIIAGMIVNTIFLVREIRRNEQHDSFINAVTHELKTPVASIRLHLETLQRRLDEEEGRSRRLLEDSAAIQKDNDRLSRQVRSMEGELSRIFGFFLTWMQEKTRGLFVGATANRIDLLPAEMIRKGRFDEVFFVDLPLEDERLEVFRVHLRRRGIDFSGFDLVPLKTFTKGWTGAEIEQCVVSALTSARLQERQLRDEDLFNATANVVPLSKTMKEQVDHIRKWAFDRAVRASPREFGR